MSNNVLLTGKLKNCKTIAKIYEWETEKIGEQVYSIHLKDDDKDVIWCNDKEDLYKELRKITN